MLESLVHGNSWQWGACGKHPLVKDYFSVGRNTALLKTFSDWMESGYHLLTTNRNLRSSLCSWCFWARGPKSGALICGLVKESSDRIGRPYPFLIIGNGFLKNWEKRWDLLPFSCEKTWNRLEAVSSGMPRDLKEFEIELERIRPPSGDWDDLAAERASLLRDGLASRTLHSGNNVAAMEEAAASMASRSRIIVPLTRRGAEDPWSSIVLWHTAFKSRMKTTPHFLFMGGTAEKTFLCLYGQAITPEDLPRLWSLVWTEGAANGTPFPG